MASNYTFEEFLLYHKIDRKLYSRLVLNLFLDPIASMQILALWLWLEQVGYDGFVMKMLAIDDTEVKMIAEEALACLYCLASISPPLITAINNLPLTQNLVGKQISLQFVYENRHLALLVITKTVNDVCVRAFADIAQEALAKAAQYNDQQEEAGSSSSSSSSVIPEYLRVGNLMMTPAPISQGPGLVRLNLYRRPVNTVPAATTAFPSVWPLGESFEMFSDQSASNLNPSATPYSQQTFYPNQGTFDNNEVDQWNNINDEIPDDGRTMFLTFSRGYQLSEREVLDFFTGLYGDCIEDLFMAEVKPPNDQPLFARMILDSPTKIVEILNGEERRKFVINGKHVWIRRFVAKQGRWRLPRPAAGPRGGAAVQE